jgi:hypothetical protein
MDPFAHLLESTDGNHGARAATVEVDLDHEVGTPGQDRCVVVVGEQLE